MIAFKKLRTLKMLGPPRLYCVKSKLLNNCGPRMPTPGWPFLIFLCFEKNNFDMIRCLIYNISSWSYKHWKMLKPLLLSLLRQSGLNYFVFCPYFQTYIAKMKHIEATISVWVTAMWNSPNVDLFGLLSSTLSEFKTWIFKFFIVSNRYTRDRNCQTRVLEAATTFLGPHCASSLIDDYY